MCSKKYREGWDRVFNQTPKKERRKRQMKTIAKDVGIGMGIVGCGILLKPVIVPICTMTGALYVLDAFELRNKRCN